MYVNDKEVLFLCTSSQIEFYDITEHKVKQKMIYSTISI